MNNNQYSGIVRLKAGDEYGTAFFIGSQLLLTARHVVCNAYNNHAVISIHNEFEQLGVCQVKKDFGSNGLDIALLETNYESPIKFNLLSLPCKFDLHKGMIIHGFPALLKGNRYTVIVDGIEVGKEESYFDVLGKVQNNSYPLENYKGLSGSPVINSRGSVIGIVTTQQFSKLGYTSTSRIQTLIDKELHIQNNWHTEDHTTYGFGRALERIEESVKYAGSRYSIKPNIKQNSLKKALDAHLDRSRISEYKATIDSIKKLIDDLATKDKAISERLQKIEGRENMYIGQIVRSLLAVSIDNSPNISDKSYYELRKVIDTFPNISDMEKQISDFNKPLLLHGKAGYGKTHFLCDYAKTRDTQTYLLFGNQFRNDEGYLTQIGDLLGFDEGIEGLDEKMKDSDSLALIIIDSINEGVGVRYWNEQLYDISNIVKLTHIRFLFSIRDSENMPSGENFRTLQITGFENPSEAIKIFFEQYDIRNDDQLNKMLETYSSVSPLFLKIYCENLIKGKNTYNKFDAYRWYVGQRNREVASIIDEDPFLNLTWEYLMKLAENSVNNYFQNIKRSDCRKIGDKIAPNRLWSKSLLNAALITNLLVGVDMGRFVDFEYEEMGDILKAASIFDQVGQQPEKAIDFIADLIEKSKSSLVLNYNKFNNGIKQFFNIPEIRNYIAEHIEVIPNFYDFIEFGSLENEKDRLSLLNLFDKSPFILGRYIIENPYTLTSEICSKIHNSLVAHSLSDRDKVWSVIINKSYDWANESFIEAINQHPSIDLLSKCKMLIWGTASSYPVVRRQAIWSTVNFLVFDISNSEPLLNSFSACNDVYVLEGLLSSLYGAFLICKNDGIEELCTRISSIIYDRFYLNEDNIPNNLALRFWSLKVLDFDNHINGKDWFKIIFKNQFLNPNNQFELERFSQIDITDEKLFGESKGARMLWNSLCGFSDFNRYIIGKNYSQESRIFINPVDKSNINLDSIVKAISSTIQDLGWTNDLGELDSNFPSRYNRFENFRERIGKKYQWIAWNNVMGCLMDKCSIYEYLGKEVPYNMPWYLDKVSRFDPTLAYRKYEDYGIIIKDGYNSSDNVNFEAWYRDDSIVFNESLIHRSEDNDEWIILSGYNSVFQQPPSTERYSFFEFDNSAFIKRDHLSDMIKWAEVQNFYGRWLPERTGVSDFLWSEYPWADSFKNIASNFDWEDINNDAPSQILLSYMAQLQEDTLGLELPDNWPSSSYAPCPDVMRVLNLYTAERGVVRELNTGKIIAIHSVYAGMKFSGIIMRKEYLDRYLKESNCALMFFICGEKSFGEGAVEGLSIKELSGAAVYTHDNGLQIIQPIHVLKS